MIIIRFDQISPNDLTNLKSFINIRGSQSGDIAGKTVICTDQKTINFKPNPSFLPGERVSVSLSPKIAGIEQAFIDSTFHFEISPITEIPIHFKEPHSGRHIPELEKSAMPKLSNGEDPQIINGISVPSNFPEFEITINDNPDTGLIFINIGSYACIFDNNGYPLWYWASSGHPMNLKVQNSLMTVNMWQLDPSIAFDSTYTIVREFISPPGYGFNDHDLKLLPNGNYLIIVDDRQQMDLTHLGGQPDAWVDGNHLAEMDAEDNLVFFWRLGGENDYFTWVNDSYRNSYQHDVRVLPNGNITMFDNGRHRSPEFSRALELSVDTTSWEVTKVWEFRNDPDIFAGWMGSVQRLPNGNTGICWEADRHSRFTEVRPDKFKAFELDLYGYSIYRMHRFSWNGKAAVPYLFVEPYQDRMTLIFNKFGDPDLLEYKIYGGLNPSPTKVLATTSEPFIHLTDLIKHQIYYFRITTVNPAGQESAFSNEEQVYVWFTYPGLNMVVNGNFSRGFYHWNQDVDSKNALADIYVTEEDELRFEIYIPGNEPSQIQASYDVLTLEKGKEYLFEFDAYAFGSRYFEAEVMQNGNNLSKMGFSSLTPNKTHFSHWFILEDESVFNARIDLNAGGALGDVYVDNVSLKEIVTSFDPLSNGVPDKFQLGNNFPNPFNPITAISYQLSVISDVELSVYNLLGEKVVTLVSERKQAGKYEVRWNASNQASGVYFYKIDAGDFHDVKKMILLR